MPTSTTFFANNLYAPVNTNCECYFFTSPYEPENGWITEQNEDEDTFATGWKDIPDQDGKKTFIVQYEFADVSKANHVYDLTDVV